MSAGLLAAGAIALVAGAVVLKLFFWTISKALKLALYGLVLLSALAASAAVWWVYVAK